MRRPGRRPSSGPSKNELPTDSTVHGFSSSVTSSAAIPTKMTMPIPSEMKNRRSRDFCARFEYHSTRRMTGLAKSDDSWVRIGRDGATANRSAASGTKGWCGSWAGRVDGAAGPLVTSPPARCPGAWARIGGTRHGIRRHDRPRSRRLQRRARHAPAARPRPRPAHRGPARRRDGASGDTTHRGPRACHGRRPPGDPGTSALRLGARRGRCDGSRAAGRNGRPAGLRRDRATATMGVVGLVSVADLAAGVLLARRLRTGEDDRQTTGARRPVRAAVTIDLPREELYARWRRLEDLPRYMENLREVRQTTERRSHWVADVRRAPCPGTPRSWTTARVSGSPGVRFPAAPCATRAA